MPHLTYTLKTIVLFSCFYLLGTNLHAQVAVPFTVRFQQNLKGDMTLISNNIVNRQDATNTPNTAYNLLGNSSEFNDNLNMRYIDIDGDASTFSSSSATLSIPNNGCNKIVYAGLYWSATYRYNNGFSTTNGDGDNIRENNFNQIKLKLPGGAYQDITGQIIFDGFTNANFISNSPYACYADITNLVSGLSNPEGEYTVANIKATQGFISGGGVSGGWTIFFVYENPTLTGKYITSYDGFAGVRANIGQVDINYSGFTTLPAPFPVRARLASAALEGDNRITGDQLLIRANSNTVFTPLSNTLNTANNFFNSRITLNDTDFNLRTPNSLNTLGYDGDIIAINNPLNSVLPNNETQATLRITSNQDAYFMFFNALNVEIIEPEIKLVKNVQDIAGNDIAGADVNLGQFLDYVITFQNIGNDDATNATIRDILPINTSFISADLSGAPGVTFTHNPVTDELVFTLPDNLLEIGDPIYTIRIRVQVATTCSELEDACSNLIQNQAYTTYQGVLNTNVISDDPSFAGLDSCGFGQPGPANFLVDIDDCIFTTNEILCGSSIQLTAANGYESYTWTNSAGTVIGTSQTITVSSVGTYTVVNVPTPPCIGITQTFNVTLFGATQANPIIPFADEVVTCPNDGEQLPLIFLCGVNDSRLIQTGINDAVSIVWEVLNENSCPAVGIADCANKNPSCTWNQVGTGANFNATTSGQYRVTINYQNGCFTRYYFNVFTNLLDIQYTATNIICNSQGSIQITNLPANYEYQLINQTTNTILVPYQNSPNFTITQSGIYFVQVRQQGVTDGCVFEVRNIGIQQNTFSVNVIPQNANCNGFGSLRVQALNAAPQYTFSITGPVTISSGLVTDNDYTFQNLNPGTYTVTVTTDDGCTSTQNVTIINQSTITLTAVISQHITCNEGNIQVNAGGGQPPYTYAIYSYNGVLQNPTSSDFQTSVIFDIPFGQQGTYQFIVVDRNNCTALSNPVTINLVPNVVFTTSVQNVTCAGASNGSVIYNLVAANGYQVSYQLLNSSGQVIASNNSGIFTGLPAGQYTVVLIQRQGNRVCNFPADYTITEPAPLMGTATLLSNYTCLNTGATIGIQPGSVSGGTAPYQYSINGITFGTNSVFSNLTAGTYTITIRDANNCLWVTNPITINPLVRPTDLSFTATPLTCPSLTSSITLAVTGGTGPFVYEIIAPSSSAIVNNANPTFTNLQAGTYTFQVTDSNGCNYQENYTLLPVNPISVLGQVTSNVSCFGGSDGSLTFTVNSNNPYNYTVTNGSGTVVASATGSTLSNHVVNGLNASVYTLLVTDTLTNCTDSASVTVSQPSSALTATLTVNPITCIGAGSVQITATGGWGSNLYTLLQPNGTQVGPQNSGIFPNLTLTGAYTVQVQDSNGCIVSNTFNLTTPTNPVAVLAASTDLCFDANGASLAITVTGGVVPYSYSLNGGLAQNNGVFNNLQPGTYTILVTDAFGCTDSITQTIYPELVSNTAIVKPLDCSITPDAAIEITISGGLAPYTFQTSFNSGTYTGSTNVAGSSFTYTTNNSGTYQFLVTDAQGCTFETNVLTISPLTLPEIVAVNQIQPILCHGGSDAEIVISVNNLAGLAPFFFEIINTTTGVNYGTVTSGLNAGVYQITLIDSNNCTDTETFTITEPSPLNFSISTVDITCNNPGGTSFGEIRVQGVTGGTAPYTYNLFNNFGFIDTYTTTSNENHSFVILNFGIYSVEVIDSNGCVVANQNITIASPPSDLIIDVSTSTVDCTTGGTAIISVTAAVSSGSYEFAILETNTLPYSSSYQPADLGTPESSTFTGLIPGVIYTFVVHDLVTDCYYFKTADTPINTPSNLNIVLDTIANVSCTGNSDGYVNVTLSNYDLGATAIGYEIFTSQSNTTTGITGTLSPLTGSPISATNLGPLAPGNYYILFTEVGGAFAGCTASSAAFNIFQSTNLLQVGANVTRNDNCNLNRGRISGVAQFGTAPYQFQLVNAGDPAPTVATWAGIPTNIFFVEGGNYVLYVRDANGCIQSTPVFVPTDPAPSISAVVTNLCSATQGNFTLEVSLTSPGIAPYTFSINGGAFQTQTVPTFTYTNLTSGNYSIRVRDFNGCIATATVSIPQPLQLSPTVTALVSCVGNDGQITLTPSGGSGSFTYNLLDGSGTTLIANQTNPQFSNLNSGTYTIEINDLVTGCNRQVSVVLDNPIPVSFSSSFTNVTCEGASNGSITLVLDASNTNPVYTFTLSNGSNPPVIQNNGLFTNLPGGNYTVTVTSSRNCTRIESFNIIEPSALTVSASATAFECDAQNNFEASQLTVTANGGTAPYFYSINGTAFFSNPVFEIADTGSVQNITVTVRDSNGCITTTPIVLNPLPEIQSIQTNLVSGITCLNDEEVEVSVVGGSGDFTFEVLPVGTQAPITPGAGVFQALFNLSTPGSYSFLITDNITGCTQISLPYEITPFDTLNVTATAVDAVICFGDTNGSVSLNVNGYSGTYTYEILNELGTIVSSGNGNTTVNPLVIGGLSGGNYTLSVVATGTPFCSATSNTFTIVSPSSNLVIAASETANVTCTNSEGEISATASGGWGNFEFQLINTSTGVTVQPYGTNALFTNLSAGTYLVSTRDSGGCIVSTTVVLTQPNLINATLNASQTLLLCQGDFTASITATSVTGGQGSYQYILNQYDASGTTIVSSSGSQIEPTFTGLGAGIYSITLTDGWGCDFTTPTVQITEPSNIIASLTVDSTLTCTTNATLSISATGGTPPYQYSSDGINYSSQSVYNVGPGVYQFFVRDANNCTAVNTNQVTVNMIPNLDLNLNLNSANINCFGENTAVIIADATGGLGNYSYTLFDGSNTAIAGPQPNGTFANLPSGIYSVRVESGDCIANSSTIQIGEPNELVVTNVNITSVLCAGGENGSVEILTQGGTGTIQFAISPNLNQFFNTGLFTDLAPGNYQIIVQDQKGCFQLLDIEITEPLPLLADVANVVQNLCLGDNDGSFDVTVTGGTAPYFTSLNNPDPAAFVEGQLSFSGLVGGTDYFIFVRDANGCETIAYVFLNAPEEVVPSATVTYNCTGNVPGNTVTVSVNASAMGNVQYALDGGTYQSSNLFQNVVSGTHIFSVQHTNGCIKTVTVNIDDNQPLQLNITNLQNVACNAGTNGSVTASTSGGTGLIEYAISPNLGTFGTLNTFNNLTAGNYTIVARDEIGCTVSQDFTISEPTAVNTTVSAITQELCVGDGNGSITLAISGGVGPYATSLNNPNNFVSNQVNFTNLTGGQTYTIYIRDANNCISTLNVPLQSAVLLTPNVNITYLCTGNVVGNTVTVTVNTAVQNEVSYALDGGAFQSSASFTNVAVGNHTITVRHTNGCEQQVPFVIQPSTPLQFTFNTTPVTCNGLTNGSIQINATGGTGTLEYAISPNLNQFGTASTFSNLAAGNYTVIVRDGIQCTRTETITITQPNTLVAQLETMFSDLCAGDNLGAIEITIQGGTAPYQTSLNPNSNFVTNQTLFENLAGGRSYTIYVRDANGCQTSLVVAVDGGVVLDAEIDVRYFCFDDPIQNRVTVYVSGTVASQVTYSLDGLPFQNSPQFTNLSNGSHTITVLHTTGCTETLTFTVQNAQPLTVSVIESNPNQITINAAGGSGSYTYFLNGTNYGNQSVINVFSTNTYTVTVVDSNNCSVTTQIDITFIDIDIPNFFTPNDDGENDTWQPNNLDGFPNVQIQVFDRYGRIITQFGQTGSWDGRYNGALLPTGDYWYTIVLDNGRQIVGNVTLYR